MDPIDEGRWLKDGIAPIEKEMHCPLCKTALIAIAGFIDQSSDTHIPAVVFECKKCEWKCFTPCEGLQYPNWHPKRDYRQ